MELDKLRPEVADAVSALDETTCMTNPGLKWYATIRAELLRLTRENAGLRGANKRMKFLLDSADAEVAEAQNTIAAQQGTMGALKRKLALAEGELAALKARMKPCARVRDGEVNVYMDVAHEGKKVAVVVVED